MDRRPVPAQVRTVCTTNRQRAGRHFGRSNRMALQRSSVTMSRGPAPNEGHRSSFYVLYSSACWFAGRAGKARPRRVDPIRREKSYGPDQELDTGAGCSHASSACRQGGTLYDFEHIQSFFRRIFHHPGLSKRCRLRIRDRLTFCPPGMRCNPAIFMRRNELH